ncbi:uncharacterized protein LOC108225396 isoform X2 [Daucus carota subsp. sativus]|uniref:uncharacterized protein LOC108225396 isoform X2 n=1 Tax=Daucus carota subsp. sativus TaxID=79200 RepID=UPI0007EF91E1|nr:PREDICTED: uncharacterized protein LOC108225396 isoform X2 [Daucus carota subsp. sativus]
MATHAGPAKGKSIASQGQKKGLGGRKALNDISNSRKPAALQPSKKHNSANVISIAEDFCMSKTKQSVLGKKSVTKAPEKPQVSGRKALIDLTNSGNPSAQAVKKSLSKNLTVVAEEEPPSGEGFLHNHQNCIASQKAVDVDYFLMAVGLRDDTCIQLAPSPRVRRLPMSRNSKLESPLKELVMEEILEMEIEDQLPHSAFTSEYNSTAFGTPHWRSPYIHHRNKAFLASPKFILKESP